MGVWSDLIDNLRTANLIPGRKNKAVDVQVIFGGISDAIAFLEGLQRGSKLLSPGTTAPSAADGLDGDAYINATTSDYYYKENGAWRFVFRLKGADGITPQKGVDYVDGRTPRKGVDYFDGTNGKSAFQLWLDAGNTGTVVQYLASLNGKDGNDGADGSRTLWESFAPTSETASLGTTWYYAITSEKYAMYEYIGPQTGIATFWRLRFTSPDAATSTGGGFTPPTSGDGTKYLNDAGTYTKPPTSSGSANFPAQGPATVGQYLQSTGMAGAEVWGGLKIGYVLRFLNAEMQEPQHFFRATTLYRIEKDNGVASVSYAINGAAAVALSFTADVWTGTLQIPAKANVVWAIAYQNGFNEGNVELLGNELLTP